MRPFSMPADSLYVVACFALLLIAFAKSSSGEDEPTSAEMDERIRAIVSAPLVLQPGDTEGIEIRTDVAYTEDGAGGPELDVYLPPRGSDEEAARPVVLFVHGGPLPPDRTPEPMRHPKDWRFFHDYGRLAASRGWIGLVPNHRFQSTEGIEQSAADLRAALRWLDRNAESLGADVERIGVWTFSGAGIHLGWLAGETPDGVCAIAAFYPVAGFAAFEPMGLGPTPEAVAERWAPVRLVDAEAPPLLIARAGADSEEINASIDAFVDAAVAAGATLDLLVHPTGPHGFDAAADVPRSRQIIERTLDFFSSAFGTPPRD